MVTDLVAEGKRIDFKRDMYRLDLPAPEKAKQQEELLKDVSSFANTLGGDLIIGVGETNGVATDVCGIEEPNPDALKNRLSQTIQDGLEPRIAFNVHTVRHSAGRIVLIIRIQPSLIAPHRVALHGKQGQFFARNDSGTYVLTTSQLRQAFTLSESING